MANTNNLQTYQGVTIITLLLSIYSCTHYSYHHKHPDNPFTANYWMLFAYWAFFYVKQIIYITYTFISNEETATSILESGWHLPIFNTLIFIWSELLIGKHYFWSELFLIANLVNVSYLYTKHKSYSIRPFVRFVIIHAPTAALPISWLIYAIFWNGALLFHVKEMLWARILANIFIWAFLGIGILWLYWFNDFAVGFSLAYLMFSLMVGQLTIRVFALQWIFALSIGSLLTIFSFGALLGFLRETPQRSTEAAPLLQGQA
ncbi:hypothetical protein JA1_002466 [Spathaspora sp. JA1]|nr:hypothetical protein JA1_002466 [Spathaspora sp. JA1]